MGEVIYPGIGTLSDLESWLTSTGSLKGSADEPLLTRLLAAAAQNLQSAVGRDMTQVTSQIELHRCPVSHRIVLRVQPVTALTAISFVPVSLTDTTALPLTVSATPNDATAYVDSSTGAGICYIPRFVMPGRHLQIQYSGGFSTVPSDFYQAVLELAGLRYKERQRIGEESKSLAGEVVHYNTKEWSNYIKGVVARYRPKVYS